MSKISNFIFMFFVTICSGLLSSQYSSNQKALFVDISMRNDDLNIGTITLSTMLDGDLSCIVLDQTSSAHQDVENKIKLSKQVLKDTLRDSASFKQGLQEGQRDIVAIVRDGGPYFIGVGFRERR